MTVEGRNTAKGGNDGVDGLLLDEAAIDFFLGPGFLVEPAVGRRNFGDAGRLLGAFPFRYYCR